jgi:hypothetical protein
MIEQYTLLKPHIINYTFDETIMYKDFDKKEAVSVSLNSSSLLRKDFTLNRIRNLISKKGLSLTVSEDGLDNSTKFIIK